MGTVGDTSWYAWLQEVANEAMQDVGGRTDVDATLLIHMCRVEPQSALVGMQFLAQQLRSMLGGRAVAAAEGMVEKTMALQLGAIALAYAAARKVAGDESELPYELQSVLRTHPIIADCMATVKPSTIG